jgi:hypothetical protein
MNKKIIITIYIGLLILQMTPLMVNTVEAPGNKNLGWRLLDNGDVFHMWNKHDDYYFDTDTGIQFTNHYQEYWTRNVLMLGHYDGDNWNLLFRNDELTDFSYNLDTTDTYINVTIWKDLTYGSYSFRFAIRYHLGINDANLTVIPYIKNLGPQIPYNLGFGWEIKDIHVGNTYNDNYIYLVNESYDLHDTVDKTYTNNSGYVIATPNYDLYLDWEAYLDYKLQVKSRVGQYNAPVTVFIVIGTLGVGQEKYTSMYWHDSELTLRPDATGSKNENLHSGTSLPESTNWQQVDEVAEDGDTTYIWNGGGGVATTEDSYNMQNHTTEVGIINDVTVYFYGKKNSGAGAKGRPLIKTHSTEYTGGSLQDLPNWGNNSYKRFSYTWDTNPNTGSNWTWTEIDDLEIGVQIYINSGGARVTQVYAIVDYDTFPVVTTNATTNLEEANVTLNGWIEENNSKDVWVRFEYGLTTSYGTNTSNQSGLTEGDTFSAVIGGLTPGTLYHYRSYINDSDDNNDTGADMTFTTKPEGPTGMAATVYTTYIGLVWTKGTGASRTTLYRKVDSTPASVGDGTLLYNGTGNSYDDYSLTADTHYYYRAWSWTTDKHSDNSTADDDNSYNDTSTNVTLCGDVIYYLDKGDVELTFVDSCVSMEYFEYDTDNNYMLFERHNLTVTNTNTHQINVSQVYSGSTVSVDTTALRFNSTYTTGTVNFNYTSTHLGNCYFDVYIDSVLTYTNITSSSFDFDISSWSTKDIEIIMVEDTSGVVPDPPYGGSSFYDNTTNKLNMFWSRGNYSDQEVVVRKAGSYPTDPDDGTVVQNNSNTFYEASVFNTGYYSLWSFNATNLTFSNTKLNIPWGAVGVTVRNESNNALLTSFGLTVTNEPGTETYHNSTCSNTHYIDMLDVPYGDNTVFVVNSTGYQNRTYYKDLEINNFYNYTFYLPPVTGGSGPGGDPDDTPNLYYVHVINEVGEPVDEASVTVLRLINGSYVEIGSKNTDGNGDCSFNLFANIEYRVNVEKTGYTTSTGNVWDTDPDYYGIYYPKTIKIYFLRNETNITTVGDCITFNATINGSGVITVWYEDICINTVDTAIYIYEYYNGTYTWNYTDSRTGDHSFSFTDTGYNISQLHRLFLYVNHSEFGFEILTYDISPIPSRAEETILEERFTSVFGDFELGWVKFFLVFVPCIFMLVVFGSMHSGLGITASGLYMGFSSLLLNLGNVSFYGTLASILVVTGIVVIIVKKGRKVI